MINKNEEAEDIATYVKILQRTQPSAQKKNSNHTYSPSGKIPASMPSKWTDRQQVAWYVVSF
ncbi:MAG: hypothetical protein WDO19_24450 [Bacteroidota bacterium]